MLNSLIEEVRLDNDISSFKIMEKKLHRLNLLTAEKCRDLGNEIRMEEDDMRGLEWEVLELEQSLDTRMQQGALKQLLKSDICSRQIGSASKAVNVWPGCGGSHCAFGGEKESTGFRCHQGHGGFVDSWGVIRKLSS